MRFLHLSLLLTLSLAGFSCSGTDDETVTEAPLAAIAGDDLNDEPRTPAPQIQIAEGQIVNIDAERSFVWVKLQDGGDEIFFRYTPDTQVQGFGDLAEGLTDKLTADSLHDIAKGTTVRIHYRPDADPVVPYNAAINTAVKIELDRPL
jgi:hypothetical protein